MKTIDQAVEREAGLDGRDCFDAGELLQGLLVSRSLAAVVFKRAQPVLAEIPDASFSVREDGAFVLSADERLCDFEVQDWSFRKVNDWLVLAPGEDTGLHPFDNRVLLHASNVLRIAQGTLVWQNPDVIQAGVLL